MEFFALQTEVVDSRLQRLQEWTQRILACDALEISTASADASFRRYFRVRSLRVADRGRTWIVMDAPPAQEDTGPYVKVAQMLTDAGVNAPRVLAQNSADGFLLLTDLGDRTYLAELTALTDDASRIADLYDDALRALVQMQIGCAAKEQSLPPYDSALLKREMELFPEWFLGKHLGMTLDAGERAVLEAAFAELSAAALAQPRVFVHRDYHSRNLMATNDKLHGPNPGILDFQDAVCGPITYDLVSLLRDCYVAWPLDRVHAWVRDYRRIAAQAGLNAGESEAECLHWFDLMGVQRHLKAIGIFARLWHRDGKRGYLQDIPRTLDYIRGVLPAYAKFRAFAHLIETRIVPALARQ